MVSNETASFSRAVIVGTGLIGSSLALAMREAKLAEHITGFDKNQSVTVEALKLGVVDEVAADAATAFANADLIVLSAPVGAASELMLLLNDHAPPGVLVIDVGSVKGAVVEAAKGVA